MRGELRVLHWALVGMVAKLLPGRGTERRSVMRLYESKCGEAPVDEPAAGIAEGCSRRARASEAAGFSSGKRSVNSGWRGAESPRCDQA